MTSSIFGNYRVGRCENGARVAIDAYANGEIMPVRSRAPRQRQFRRGNRIASAAAIYRLAGHTAQRSPGRRSPGFFRSAALLNEIGLAYEDEVGAASKEEPDSLSWRLRNWRGNRFVVCSRTLPLNLGLYISTSERELQFRSDIPEIANGTKTRQKRPVRKPLALKIALAVRLQTNRCWCEPD